MTGPDAARAYAGLYAPTAEDLRLSLPDIADGLHAKLCELSARPTPDRAEILAVYIAGAHRTVLKFREAMLREGSAGVER